MRLSKEVILDYMEKKNARIIDVAIHFDVEPQYVHDVLNGKEK